MRAEQQVLLAQINSQKSELLSLKEMIMNNKFSDKKEDEVRDLLHDNEVRNSPVRAAHPVGWVAATGKPSSSRKISAADNIFGDIYGHVDVFKVNNTWT